MEIFNLIKELSKNSLSLASNMQRLLHLEIALAKKSLPILAGLLFIMGCFVISAWIFVLALLVVYLHMRGISLYCLLFSGIAVHLLLILIVALLLRKYLNHLKLPITRKHMSVFFKQSG